MTLQQIVLIDHWLRTNLINMTPSQYLTEALRTEPKNLRAFTNRLLHAGIGMSTEAGEFLDAIKKSAFYGKEIDKTNLIEEAGDILWYMAIFCAACEVSFEDLMYVNIQKLKKRYPGKWSKEKALKRDLEGERKILLKHHLK